MSKEKFTKLCELITSYSANPGTIDPYIDFNVPELKMRQEVSKDIKDNFEVEITLYGKTFLRISTENLNFMVFMNLDDFLGKIKNSDFIDGIGKIEFRKDIAIIDSNGSKCYYDTKNDQVFFNETEVVDNFLFSNVCIYFEFLRFLDAEKSNKDANFSFVDNFSWTNKLVEFTSLKKEGRVAILIPAKIPQFPNKDLRKTFSEFYKIYDLPDKKMYFPRFLKVQVFEKLSKATYDERMFSFITEFEIMCAEAEQNLHIFLSDLSLDKFKKDFLDFKSKYLLQLREILGKITSQVIALPISVSATVIATYNVRELRGSAWIVLLAFIIYAIFAVYLLRNFKEEIEDMGDFFIKEFEEIKEMNAIFVEGNSFLPEFEDENEKIKTKFSTSITTVWLYFVFHTLVHSVIVGLILNYLALPEVVYFGIPVVFILVCLLLFWSRQTSNQPKLSSTMFA